MQDQGGFQATSTPSPALAYWLPTDALAAVRAAAERALRAAGSTPALRDAFTELAAAPVRSRWFDHPAAASFRRIAGHPPDTVTVRLTPAEHAALIACDPAIGPALDDDTAPAGTAPGPAAGTPDPLVLPTGPAGPVVVLDHDGTNLQWAVAEFDGATISTGRPSPHAAIWTRACEVTRREPVDVETHHSARRLTATAHPALSTLALARPDLRPRPDEAVLLRLPHVVVVAPGPIATRVAAYAAPSPVLVVAADALPAEPTPASTVG